MRVQIPDDIWQDFARSSRRTYWADVAAGACYLVAAARSALAGSVLLAIAWATCAALSIGAAWYTARIFHRARRDWGRIK